MIHPTSKENTSRTFEHRVSDIIASLLATGAVQLRIDLVAQTMGMSVRSFQRRLQGIGKTYSELVQRVRRAAAQQMLAHQATGIAEVARLLGYSDPAHFSRAFHRWTGCTPRKFRASEGGTNPDRRRGS